MSDRLSDPSTPQRSRRVLSMVLRNRREELPRIAEHVDRFAKQFGLSGDDTTHLNLALDELVSNIIKYAYDDAGEHHIHVNVEIADDVLTVSVDDDGKAFNPLEAPLPNLDLPIDERPIGGLGVFLVRSMADHLEYRRDHGHNLLTLTKRLSAS